MFESWRNLSRESISLYVRVMSAAIAVALFVIGWDLVLAPNNADLNQDFYQVVREMAPLPTWGALLWVVSMCYIVAAVSGRFAIYALAMVWSVAIQGALFSGILWAKYVGDAELSSVHIGLWILALSLTIGTAFVPHPLRPAADSTIQLLDEHDRTVIELKRSA
jgi:hypothetical protein